MLAAVDSGKTTLTEAILYTTGTIRSAGRVDHGDSHLDTNAIERERGITIFSKQAEFEHGGMKATILDTPGHVDFAAEMERTLSVIDYAVLIIGANDGIKAHTATLWKLLAKHRIPVFVFVNKIDLADQAEDRGVSGQERNDGNGPGSSDRETASKEIRERLTDNIRGTASKEIRERLTDEINKGLGAELTDFSDTSSEEFLDEISMVSDKAAELVLSDTDAREKREAIDLEIIRLIKDRELFPVYFGSALRFSGVEALIDGLERYTAAYRGDEKGEPSGRIFKVAFDGQDRVTFMKVTAGRLKPRQVVRVVPRGSASGAKSVRNSSQPSGDAAADPASADGAKTRSGRESSGVRASGAADGRGMKVPGAAGGRGMKTPGAADSDGAYDEKINEIRIYSGDKYKVAEAAGPGDIVAVTGLSAAVPGDAVGSEMPSEGEVLQPYMTYNTYAEHEEDTHALLDALSMLAAEDPKLETEWLSGTKQIVVRIMGAVQLEVLARLIKDRFGISCTFGEEKIIYKETVSGTYEGVGHFEPLRHYAEAHVVISPAERGSGITVRSECPLELLDINWQNLVMSVLERHHLRGTLTGAPLTDVDICLVAGRASKKHTEGGDFREASLRAVRQGLMQALEAGDMVLLEPWLDFRVETETPEIGAIMTDIDNMGGSVDPPEISADGSTAVLTGRAPAAGLRGYSARLAGSAHGRTQFSCAMGGYDVCADARDVIERAAYDPDRDVRNPADSVFCSQGSGDIIKWDQVSNYMHIPSVLEARRKHMSIIPGGQTDEMLAAEARIKEQRRRREQRTATDKELKAIFEQTYGPIKHYRPPKQEEYDYNYDEYDVYGEYGGDNQQGYYAEEINNNDDNGTGNAYDSDSRRVDNSDGPSSRRSNGSNGFGAVGDRGATSHSNGSVAAGDRGATCHSNGSGASSSTNRAASDSSGGGGSPASHSNGGGGSPAGDSKGSSRRGFNEANRRGAGNESSRRGAAKARIADQAVTHLFVDGYNLIHAWPELKELADVDFGSARDELTDIICNYSGFMGYDTVLVYDAYKVTEGVGSRMVINGITVVYTREHETADAFIERETLNLMKHIKAGKSTGGSAEVNGTKTGKAGGSGKNDPAHKALNGGRRYGSADRIIVVTSDNLEQIVSMGHGALRISSREFINEIARVNDQIRTMH